MRHALTAMVVTLCLLCAGLSYAATYGWSGGGSDNLWSNGNNWTNVADGSSGTVPGASDTAQFGGDENDAVALTSDVTINNLVLGEGGMSITGAYTLTLTASSAALQFGSAYTAGGSATIDCNINMPNLSGGNRIINWNQTLTINGNLALPPTTAGFNLEAWGPNALLKINGQVTGWAAGQAVRNIYMPQAVAGQTEIVAQHDPVRNFMLRQGTLVLKGNYDAPNGDENRVGFPSWDGATPKKIWLAVEGGLGIFSNRWSFSPRSNDTKYHEFRVMAPTKHAKLLGRVRIDDKLWWFVDPDCYVEIVNTGIEKGDSATTMGVYMSGGGTTDVKVAQINAVPIPFIVSNGVLLVNNASGFALHGPVTVCAGGVFGGAGTAGSTVTCESGGIISPGNSIGTLTVSNAVLQAGSIVDWEVNGTTADKLAVLNNLDISAGIVTVRVYGTTSTSATNTLFSYASLNGSSANLVFDLSQSSLSGGSFVMEGNQILVTGLVPEPGLAVAVLAGLVLAGRKRR